MILSNGTRRIAGRGTSILCIASIPASGYERFSEVPAERPCHQEWRDGVKARLEEQRAIARELLGE